MCKTTVMGLSFLTIPLLTFLVQSAGPAFSQRSEKRRSRSPLARAATEGGPQAVPVATKEATGIDSRDEGVPLPLRISTLNPFQR